jgi:hypothetical protein
LTIYEDDTFLLVTGSVYTDGTITFVADYGIIVYLEAYILKLDFPNEESTDLFVLVNGNSMIFCNEDGSPIEISSPQQEGAYTIGDFTSEDLKTGYGYNDLSFFSNADSLHSLYEKLLIDCQDFSEMTEDYEADDGTNLLNAYSMSQYDLTTDEGLMVFKVFILDHPEFFWLSNTLNIFGDSLNVYITPEYQSYQTRLAVYDGLMAMINELDEVITIDMGDLNIAYYLHDYIISRIDYAYEEDGITPQDDYWAHNIEGIVLEEGVVCEGYAELYKILLDHFGIYNILITGESGGEEHEFNLVNIEGTFYVIDLTWDDPGNDEISITYFGMGYPSIIQTHTFDTPDEIGINYLYHLPAISDDDITLVNLFYNDNNLGWFVSIDFAFEEMTDPEGNYELKLANYGYFGPDLFSTPIRVFQIKTENFPYANSIDFQGNATVSPSQIYVLTVLAFVNENVNNHSEVTFIDTTLISSQNETILNFSDNIIYLNGLGFSSFNVALMSENGSILNIDLSDKAIFWSNINLSEINQDNGSIEIRGLHNVIHTLNLNTPNPNYHNHIMQNVETLTINTLHVSENYFGNMTLLFIYMNNKINLTIQDIIDDQNSEMKAINIYLDTLISFPTINILGHSNVAIRIDLQDNITVLYIDDEGILRGYDDGYADFAALEDIHLLYAPNLNESDFHFYDFQYGLISNLITKDENGYFSRTLDYSIVVEDGVLLSVTSMCNSEESINIVIPDGVESIHPFAFQGAQKIKTLYFPESLTEINDEVVSQMMSLVSLEAINVSENNPVFTSIDGILFSKDGTQLIYYPQNKPGINYIVPDGVLYLYDSSFRGSNNLITVNLPEGLLEIGNYAFSVSSISEIAIPDSVLKIGRSAFSCCPNLTTIGISEYSSLKYIGDDAFMRDILLDNFYIPSGVEYVGNRFLAYNDYITIYVQLDEIPSTWNPDWNCENRPIVLLG